MGMGGLLSGLSRRTIESHPDVPDGWSHTPRSPVRDALAAPIKPSSLEGMLNRSVVPEAGTLTLSVESGHSYTIVEGSR
jgi:hypothetical protein